MKQNFDIAFNYLLKDEGTTYVNDPLDSGGPTKFGITQKTYEQYLRRLSTTDEIKNMTAETAKLIYADLYWKPLKCSEISSLVVAICLFNSGVLYGVGSAGRLAQRALNKCGANLKPDGILGDKSIAVLNAVDSQEFIKAFHSLLLVRIELIILKRPKDERFRKGWMNRANRLLTLHEEVAALKIA